MRLPIPNDWDETTWRCVEIQWPDSVQYNGILLGLLSYLTRGRAWDERTGFISDAQAVGWQIFNANYPLNECAVCDDGSGNGGDDSDQAPYTNGQISARGTGSELGEECDMGQVVTDVAIVNGQIRVFFGPCCYKDLGAIADIVDQSTASDIDPPWEGTGGETPTYSACAKANAIVEAVYLTVGAAVSALEEWPWRMVPYIEETVGYDLDNKWLFALLAAVAVDVFLDPPDVWNDEIEKARIIHRVELILPDDSTGVPTDELFEQIKGCFLAEQQFDFWNLAFDYALNAWGRHDLDTVAKTNARSGAYDCEMPVVIPDLFEGLGTDYPWRYVFDFRTGSLNWTFNADNHQLADVGIWGDSGTTTNRVLIAGTINLDQLNNGSSIKLVGMAFECIGDENWDNNYVNLGTEEAYSLNYATVAGVAGSNPATPGYHEAFAFTDNPLGATENQFKVQLGAYHPPSPPQHPDEAQYSQKLVALLFAGTGPGPLSSPPA